LKFISTSGREFSIDIRPSKWKRKDEGEGRGIYQSQVGEILSIKFPAAVILEEFPMPGEGLYLDFFLPSHRIAVEIQGTQHYHYNKFFHGDKSRFVEQQNRDRRKAEWCKINHIRLVIIDYGEKEENIISKIKA
jgi:hypothetical protein